MKTIRIIVLALSAALVSSMAFAAGSTISNLPAATVIGASDVFPIVQAGVNKKVTYSTATAAFQPTATAINTGNIAAQHVSLADSATTATNASGTGSAIKSRGEIGLNILRGRIACGSSASIVSGSGFTVSKVSTGVYAITFDTPFATFPVVTTSAMTFGEMFPAYSRISTLLTNKFNMCLYDSTGTLSDSGYLNFIAIGE